MATVTLDYIKNILMDEDNLPLDNYHALDYLPTGLHVIATIVREEEVRLFPSKVSFMMSSSSNGRAAYRDALFACYFNWFGVSLVNYMNLVGLIDIMTKENWRSFDIAKNREIIKKYCQEYLKEVIPEIYLWRNKIAAHPAITDPHKEDNLGTLEYSIMNPVSYKKPYFTVGAFSWTKSGEQSNLPEWALTEIFRNLLRDYGRKRNCLH